MSADVVVVCLVMVATSVITSVLCTRRLARAWDKGAERVGAELG
jgi:hypothetical protein